MGRFYFEEIQGRAAMVGRRRADPQERLNDLVLIERPVIVRVNLAIHAAQLPEALAGMLRAVLDTGLSRNPTAQDRADALLYSRLPMVDRLARLWRDEAQHVATPLGYLGEDPAEWLLLHERAQEGTPEVRAEVERRLLRQQADEARGCRPAWLTQARARWNVGRAVPWVGPDGEAHCCACSYEAPTRGGRFLPHDTEEGHRCEGTGTTPAELRARLERRALRKARAAQSVVQRPTARTTTPRPRRPAGPWHQTALFSFAA